MILASGLLSGGTTLAVVGGALALDNLVSMYAYIGDTRGGGYDTFGEFWWDLFNPGGVGTDYALGSVGRALESVRQNWHRSKTVSTPDVPLLTAGQRPNNWRNFLNPHRNPWNPDGPPQD